MASAREAFQRQRAVNMGAASSACVSTSSTVSGAQKFEDHFQRKRVLLAQRDDDAVIGGGGLQFEIERAAEALAQRQSPGAVDARAERRVDHELHAAAFVEEALGHHACRSVGIAPSAARAGLHVVHGLFGAAGGPGRTRTARRRHRAARPSPRAAAATSRESSARAAGRFAAPERNAGRRAVGVLHAHAPRFDAADAPGRGAQQEDVAGHALHGEILVHRAHRGAFRLGHHQVLRGVRNGAARSDGGEPRAAPAAQPMVHRVAMQVGSAAPARRGDAFGEHRPAPRRNRRAPACGKARRGAPGRTARPRRTPRRRTRPPSAAPEYRARCAESPGGPARRGGWRAPARRIRSARRAWWRRCGPWAARPPSARRGRCAAAPPRWSAASRSGRPGPPCRYRCPVRAMRSPPRRAVRRSSAAAPPPGAARARGCRGAAAPRSRPAARPGDAPRARTGGAC